MVAFRGEEEEKAFLGISLKSKQGLAIKNGFVSGAYRVVA
jgi:hypothetical protein